jgi:hypothetical protein
MNRHSKVIFRWVWWGSILAASLPQYAVAQSVPPQSAPPSTGQGTDRQIVINPTIEDCRRGWSSGDSAKWSKEQFDQFCAVLKSPPAIVINPTLDQCARGWTQSMRWTKDEFENFCTDLTKSK